MANAYVTTDDFKRYLLSCGLLIKGEPEDWETFFTFEAEVDRAAQTFEAMTGRKFVAAQKVRHYDLPRGPRLSIALRDDLLSVNSLTLNAGAWGGLSPTPFVLDKDFYLLPYDADQDGLPFTLLQFAPVYQLFLQVPTLLSRKTIALDGIWGRMAVPSALVKSSILARAAEYSVPRLSLAITKGLMSWSAPDGRRMEYSHYGDQIPMSAERKMWELDFLAGVQAYLRVEVF